jgi:L-alanine-DL-glutamate epimerase-like enolase superfamily enzyme
MISSLREHSGISSPLFTAEIFIYRSRFSFGVRHAHGSRKANDVLGIRVSGALPGSGADGVHQGIGESLPRDYVTGEKVSISVATQLFRELAVPVMAAGGNLQRAIGLLFDAREVASAHGAIALWSGFDIALVDWLARVNGCPVSDVIRQIHILAWSRAGLNYPSAASARPLPFDAPVRATIPMLKPWLAGCLAGLYRMAGFRLLKVKVGGQDDVQRVEAVLRSQPANLTLDANQGLSENAARKLLDDAVNMAVAASSSIAAFEDPVATPSGHDARAAMARFARGSRVPVMVDEPLSGAVSCRDFSGERDIRLWNLRVGKCGGITGTILAAATAKSRGIDVVLGALVGEGLPLMRAAKLLHGVIQPLWVDAAFSRWVVSSDVHASRFRWSPRRAGDGMGIRLCEAKLRRSMISYGAIRCMAAENLASVTPHESRTLRAPDGPNGSPGIMTTRAFSSAHEANP